MYFLNTIAEIILAAKLRDSLILSKEIPLNLTLRENIFYSINSIEFFRHIDQM